jgi:hypothetical protein
MSKEIPMDIISVYSVFLNVPDVKNKLSYYFNRSQSVSESLCSLDRDAIVMYMQYNLPGSSYFVKYLKANLALDFIVKYF